MSDIFTNNQVSKERAISRLKKKLIKIAKKGYCRYNCSFKLDSEFAPLSRTDLIKFAKENGLVICNILTSSTTFILDWNNPPTTDTNKESFGDKLAKQAELPYSQLKKVLIYLNRKMNKELQGNELKQTAIRFNLNSIVEGVTDFRARQIVRFLRAEGFDVKLLRGRQRQRAHFIRVTFKKNKNNRHHK